MYSGIRGLIIPRKDTTPPNSVTCKRKRAKEFSVSKKQQQIKTYANGTRGGSIVLGQPSHHLQGGSGFRVLEDTGVKGCGPFFSEG